MNYSDVLMKEELYRKMNFDIKRKTHDLMKEMECRIDDDFKEIMKDDFPERGKVVNPAPAQSSGLGRSGSEGLIRILQAKVKVLREQLNTLQTDYTRRTDEWKSLQAEIVKVEENSLKNKYCLLSTQDQLKKQEKLVSTLTSHLQIRDRENGVLKKQIESLKRELKQQEMSSSGHEVRLNRSLEEIEKLKESLRKSQYEEKELKDANRVRQEECNKILSRLEKQKSELILSFKKQVYLINNLKKQQGILETSRLVSLTEEEFNKLLDWTPAFT
ncbi:testis-expressed protein 9 [Lycorma delicatula]|uniref:testis-expressed protein 9 n=1 Tax=Lycorma delicatula TaxID=130591 RepID=UPI003F51A2AB